VFDLPDLSLDSIGSVHSDFLVIRLHGPDRKEIETKSKGVWDDIVFAMP